MNVDDTAETTRDFFDILTALRFPSTWRRADMKLPNHPQAFNPANKEVSK